MTSSELWAAIALLALAGWAWNNWTVQRSFVPNANAFSVLEKLNERQDDQIRKTVERIMDRRGGTLPAPNKSASQGQQNPGMEMINQVLGGNVLEPISEQPDSDTGVEIVE